MAQRLTLDEFMANYTTGTAAKTTRVLLDVDLPAWTGNLMTPFIVLRAGDKVLVLNPMTFPDHLVLDAHAFVAGRSADIGVVGFTEGRRHSLPDTLPTTSHGQPAVGLATLLLGNQGTRPKDHPTT